MCVLNGSKIFKTADLEVYLTPDIADVLVVRRDIALSIDADDTVRVPV